MDFEYFIFLGFAGLLSTAYKVAAIKEIDSRVIIKETLLSLLISLVFVPAIMEHHNMSLIKAMALTALITIFSNDIFPIARKKLIALIQKLEKF
jgi:hypothetical protein